METNNPSYPSILSRHFKMTDDYILDLVVDLFEEEKVLIFIHFSTFFSNSSSCYIFFSLLLNFLSRKWKSPITTTLYKKAKWLLKWELNLSSGWSK